ncbi:cell surface protein [Vibrio navarrensis]|uniref:cell surface protein n=1 Tax=Vibrio navarrensis TaxID=29495 RepID=UPI001869D375|nr:cell surface protein [Vibrio navarrensis]MBE4598979.1 cell surface protein [Vibrio navarrensis]
MYKQGLVSIPLIMMLTACGSDSNSGASSDTRQFKGLKFAGMVYDGPISDATVSIYVGNKLLATAKTDQDGKYSAEAKVFDDEYENIKSLPITYKAQRDQIIFYEYAGQTLEQALSHESVNALISNFSTVEYVLADVNKDDFVSANEWDAYQSLDRNYAEQMIIRYGVGLKSIVDFSGSLAGFENTTVWLRNLRSDVSWGQWHRLNDIPYTAAWDSLFADTWFLDQEAHRFISINAWSSQYENVISPDPQPASVKYVLVTGLPQMANVGDWVSPSMFALWSDTTSSDISNEAVITITPATALEKVGARWKVKHAGTITFKAEYNGVSTSNTFTAEGVGLDNIVLSGVGKNVKVGDKLLPLVSAMWTDNATTEVTRLSAWSYTPADAIMLVDGQLQVVKTGEIALTASYQGATSTITFNAEPAALASLRIESTQREQYLGDQFQVSALGIHENDYVLNVSDSAEWTSSDPEILESLGGGLFLSKGVGSATVTATLEGFSTTQQFDVVAKLTGISLNLPNKSVSRNQSIQLSLNGEFNDGSVSEIIEGVQWATSQPEILAIDEKGVATGLVEGSSVVSASYKGLTLEETVTVTQAMIISSVPEFVNGEMVLNEGAKLPYVFKFTRSNGVVHEFAASADGLNFESYGFRAEVDASGLQIADLDKEADLMRGVRAGKTKLALDSVPVDLQQIFVELGALASASDYPTRVDLPVSVVDNQDVYQWHKLAGNATSVEGLVQIQAVQNGNALYRFWQVGGTENGSLFVSKVTASGESDAVEVALPTTDFKLLSNQVISGNNGYVMLVTSNKHVSGVIPEHKAYRYTLADGALAEVDTSKLYNKQFNLNADSFYFAANGNLILLKEDDASLVSVFDFTSNTWTDKVASLNGKPVQLPSQYASIAALDTTGMDYGAFAPPTLNIFDLETQTVTSQQFIYPGDAQYFCAEPKSVSVAVRAELKDSGAGCQIAARGSYDIIGYWIWNSINEAPHTFLFADGKSRRGGDNYGVALVKPDGNVAYSAGRQSVDGTDVFNMAEIVDVEVDGVIEKQVRHQVFNKKEKVMDGAYSKFSVIDGNQFAIVNADVKDELFSVFTHGVAVKDELGQWASDSFMYQLPVSVTSSDTKLYNLGDTLVLSTEGQASTEYWVLQLRKPLLDPTTGEEPAVE